MPPRSWDLRLMATRSGSPRPWGRLFRVFHREEPNGPPAQPVNPHSGRVPNAWNGRSRVVGRRALEVLQAPPFVINPALARFRAGDVAGLESLFGRRRQSDESPTEARFADAAAALQRRTEEAMLALPGACSERRARHGWWSAVEGG